MSNNKVKGHMRGTLARASRYLLLLLVFSCLNAANAGLNNLLPVINKIQDAMSVMADRTQSIELPQIVVVGSQSSGKSSVLESIVGKDFLPRGSGIVTRCPLILQLQNQGKGQRTPTASPPPEGCDEWGEFLHCPSRKFTDFKEIRKEIEAETSRITGINKKFSISHSPIRLRITSPRVPNLTLVDLPGMTKVPVGDQPKDIEVQIRDLVLQYIANPNSVILAITPANSDIATSEAIQLAKAVDPSGSRTVGVLTKIDLMDKGTNAREALLGKVIPLKLGFIGVINRSQKDIMDEKEMDAARKDEMKFFQEHPSYVSLAAAGKIGTAFLAKRLNNILLLHIKARLPALRGRVSALISSTRKELSSLGEAPSEEVDEQRKLLISIITQYVDNFCTTIDGGRHLTSYSELRGGARISHTFNELYPHRLGAIHPHENLKPMEIYTTIRNTKGARTSLYGSVPQDAFEMLVKRLVKQLREPSSWCVDTVFDELRVISEQCEPTELGRFESLRVRFREVVQELLSRCYKDAKKMMENLIAFELAYINTNHPDFIDVGAVLGATFTHPEPKAAYTPSRPPAQPQQKIEEGEATVGGVSNWFSNVGKETAKQSKAGAVKSATPAEAAAHPEVSATPVHNRNELANSMQQDRQARRAWIRQGLQEQGLLVDRREEAEMELVITLIVSYFDIVRKNLRDSLPKAIMHFMVNQAKEKIQVELLRHLYREDLMQEVFHENEEIKTQREGCRKMLDVLNKAVNLLNEVNSHNE
mmetsp:Transcript_15375/g.51631  ORF Transcript_15375/g.51631 Transcript_15375/m.51631 type:complete len:761 (-) Transcript_15375:6-2288(-)